MGELLREIFARPSTKIFVGSVALIVVVVFMWSGLKLGAAADGCAERLVTATKAKDEAALKALVKTPSMRARLLEGQDVDLQFVRRVSPQWSRVGLLVKTSTSQDLVLMQLESNDGDCQFLRDY